MRYGMVVLALLLLGAGAWWMYSDREQRLGGEEAPARADAPTREPSGPGPLDGREGEGVKRALPGDARDVLESGDVFELLALHPDRDEAAVAHGEQVLHGWRVLGRAPITEAAERRALLEALYASLNGNDGLVADCFIPRHGLRAVKGDRVVEVVICFECLQLLAFGAGVEEPTSGYLLAETETAFDAALKRHGLPKAR